MLLKSEVAAGPAESNPVTRAFLLRLAAFLALTLAALFPQVIAGSGTFYYRDYGVLAYPTISYQHDSFWRGELPLWNPYSNCGVPFLAQWGTMVLYPFSLVYLLFPLPWSLNLFCLGHLVLAGAGMSALANRWIGGRMASSIAGFAFVFSGFTLSSLMWPNYCVALGWMPWVVLRVERAWKTKGAQSLALAAVIATLQLLAGVPEIVVLTWVLLGGIWLSELHSGASRSPLADTPLNDRPGMLHSLFRIALVILLAGGLAAAQLLPFLELLAHSQRVGGVGPVKWAMPLWALGDFLLPLFHCAQSPQGVFFQLGQEFFSSNYLGIVALALALFAFSNLGQRKVWLLAGLSLLGLGLALGENGMLYSALRKGVPLSGLMRYPIKFLVLPAFIMPLLAAYGMREVLSVPSRPVLFRRTAAIAALMALGLGTLLWITWTYPTIYEQRFVVLKSAAWRGLILLAGIVWVALDQRLPGAAARWPLAAFGLGLFVWDGFVGVPGKNLVLPASVLAPGLWEMQNKTPPPKLGEGRVMISPFAEERLLNSPVPDLSGDFIGKRLALWSHLNLIDLVPKVNGSSTLQIKEEKQVESCLYGSTNTALTSLNRFLGVTYSTSPAKVIDWTNTPGALALVTAGQKPSFLAPAETLTALSRDNFDPAATVYLPAEAQRFIGVTNAAEVKVASLEFSTHQVKCTVEAAQASLLVVAQTYYGAWRAYLDGASTRIWPANYAFQAIEIPAGHHEILFRYEDKHFRLGLAISVVSLMFCGALFLQPRLFKRN